MRVNIQLSRALEILCSIPTRTLEGTTYFYFPFGLADASPHFVTESIDIACLYKFYPFYDCENKINGWTCGHCGRRILTDKIALETDYDSGA